MYLNLRPVWEERSGRKTMLGPEVLVWLETLNPKPSAVRIPESVPGRWKRALKKKKT